MNGACAWEWCVLPYRVLPYGIPSKECHYNEWHFGTLLRNRGKPAQQVMRSRRHHSSTIIDEIMGSMARESWFRAEGKVFKWFPLEGNNEYGN